LAFSLNREWSGFFYYTLHQKFWIPPDVNVAEISRRLIATPKLTVTIFWDFGGARD
jgi:hypothetical protein